MSDREWEGPFWAVQSRHGWMKKIDQAEAERDARIGAKVSAPREVVQVLVRKARPHEGKP